MKRNRLSLPIVVAFLIGSAPVWAHEECDDSKETVASSSEHVVGPALPPGANVTIKLFQYQPGRLQVRAGTTVTWINDDEIVHTVTAEKEANGFDAALDGKGKTFSFTFSKPGIYSYYCDRHEHMRGEIEVR